MDEHLVVGSKVRLIKSTLERDCMLWDTLSENTNAMVGRLYAVGYVVQECLANAVMIVFQDGYYGGFSEHEQLLYLENLGVDSRYAVYNFNSVWNLSEDYRNGYWKFED